MSEPRKIRAPFPLQETQAYWDGADEGKLMLRKCNSCGRAHHYPRQICPHCQSDDTHWFEASGNATIYTFSQMLVGPQPYVIAFVELEEGPKMMTNIVDCDASKLEIGQKLSVTFVKSDNGPNVPMFKPLT